MASSKLKIDKPVLVAFAFIIVMLLAVLLFIMVGVFLRHAFADHERQEAVVRQSPLDWTLVRPPHLKDGPRTGVYRHGFPTTDKRIKGWISRADVADFMLKQLVDDTYLQTRVADNLGRSSGSN